MLRATAACNFLTSNLRKVVRTPQFFHILTYKYASRHSGVPFLNIGTSKMGPGSLCFPHFDLQMCFAPQPRGIFGTSELPKWLRECGVLHILTFKRAFRHSRVPFFTCPPNSYLRTRRFSEPTFRTSGTTIH